MVLPFLAVDYPKFYFVIKTGDEYGNISPLRNIGTDELTSKNKIIHPDAKADIAKKNAHLKTVGKSVLERTFLKRRKP